MSECADNDDDAEREDAEDVAFITGFARVVV
jgi:hypothetical protein